jgi:hypothetical protein
MKFISSLIVLAALVALTPATISHAATDEEGVALAIIYDTSGSMRETVHDESGKPAPKYVIANRALIAITQQLEAFATNTPSGAPRKLQVGLFIFGENGAREAVKFGPFDGKAIRDWAKNFSTPAGNTPLGNALKTASQAVLDSPLARKHVLIITDGVNTAGPTPGVVMPKLKQQAEQKHASLSVHFVAFDVDAKVFDPVKKLGATVVGAANERQLKTQLDYIVQKKILLEEEEPPKKSN